MADPCHAVLLLRNSDASQDLSLEEQREACERFAKERGYTVRRAIKGFPDSVFRDGAFFDDAVSGVDTEKRHGFQALLKAAKDPNVGIGAVICYNVSRFGRFDTDEAGYWRYQLRQAGVDILYVAEGFQGDDSDDLVRAVKQWLGRKFLQDLSQDTVRGLIAITRKGYWYGGIPPFGFDLAYESVSGNPLFVVRFEPDGSKLVLDLDGAIQQRVPRGERVLRTESQRARLRPGSSAHIALVCEIFELYAAGRGFKTIAGILNQRGVPAVRDGKWSRRHKKGWSHGTVRNIVTNRAYVGDLVYNKTSFSRFHRIRRAQDGYAFEKIDAIHRQRTERLPERDWIIVENAHARIISPELWARVQSVRSNRRKPHARGSTASYIFTSLLDCEACSHHFQGHTCVKGKTKKDGAQIRTRAYLCGGYNSKGTAVCPSRWTVNEASLWQSVIEAIGSEFSWLLTDERFLQAVVGRAAEILTRRAPQTAGSVDEIRRRVCEIENNIDRLVTNIAPENRVLINTTLTELREERDGLGARLEAAQDEPAAGVTKQQAIAHAANALRAAFAKIDQASAELRRRFIRCFIDRIELNPREKTGTAWLWRFPTTVLDSLGLPVRSIAGAGLEPATSGPAECSRGCCVHGATRTPTCAPTKSESGVGRWIGMGVGRVCTGGTQAPQDAPVGKPVLDGKLSRGRHRPLACATGVVSGVWPRGRDCTGWKPVPQGACRLAYAGYRRSGRWAHGNQRARVSGPGTSATPSDVANVA